MSNKNKLYDNGYQGNKFKEQIFLFIETFRISVTNPIRFFNEDLNKEDKIYTSGITYYLIVIAFIYTVITITLEILNNPLELDFYPNYPILFLIEIPVLSLYLIIVNFYSKKKYYYYFKKYLVVTSNIAISITIILILLTFNMNEKLYFLNFIVIIGMLLGIEYFLFKKYIFVEGYFPRNIVRMIFSLLAFIILYIVIKIT